MIFALNIIDILPKITRTKFVGVGKCGTIKDPFAMIISLSETVVKLNRLLILVKTKEMIFTSNSS